MKATIYIHILVSCAALSTGAIAQPIITSQPVSTTNLAGTTATFSIAADGTPPLAFQWWFSNSVLNVPLAGGGGQEFMLANVSSVDLGGYYVVVTNLQGAVTSLVAELTVRTPPRMGLQPTNQTASLFADVTFRASAGGDSPLSFQWRFYDVDLAGMTNTTLSVTNVQKADVGNYDVVITNLWGSVTSKVATISIVPFNSVYAFGYSWTDTHNCTWDPTLYWHNRASNGPLWPEYTSTNLGLVYVAGNNYAHCGAGGAEVLNQAMTYPVPKKPQLSIYFLMFSDDILYAWPGTPGYVSVTNETRWAQIIQTGILQNSNAVANLYAKGARNIVAQSEIDISNAPDAVSTFGASSEALAKIREYCIRYNTGFSNAMQAFSQSRPDVRLIWVDLFSTRNDVVMHPELYGFTVSNIGALDDPSLTNKSFTGPGADYVFWDHLHGTTKLNELVTVWNLDAVTNCILEKVDINLLGNSFMVQMNHLQIGRDYTLQSSSDLTVWRDVQAFIASAGTNLWALPGIGKNADAEFYRLTWSR